MAHTVYRLRRSAPAQVAKRLLLRRRSYPMVGVVVPFHGSAPKLADCLDSLLSQDYPNLDVVLVDDGAAEPARQVAAAYARRHPQVRLVAQPHSGVGAARNLGISRARGRYLAFCDSDDVVAPHGYARLVEILEASGSDLAVGAVAIQDKGRYQVPAWARRSNARRRAGVHVNDVPEVMANLMPGARMFRRSFWDRAIGGFGSDDERSDPSVMASAFLAADAIDIVPAVVYRWSWREDNRSLWQRDLRETRRVTARLASLCDAGELVVARASRAVQHQFFAEVLHTTVPTLVRAAVCRNDDYWSAVHAGLRRLVDTMPAESLASVPAEDRLVAWLCSRGERAATEVLLEYAQDNSTGLPFRLENGRPAISLPFIDVLEGVPSTLTRVADADLRFRSRLLRLGWVDDSTLRVEGAAFAEYLDDRCGPSRVTLTLTERGGAGRLVVRAAPNRDIDVNGWANRANEDHTGATFTADVDVSALPTSRRPALQDPVVYDSSIRLEIAGYSFEGPFGSHRATGSAGLFESTSAGGLLVRPYWREHHGLGLRIGVPSATAPPEQQVDPVVVEDVHAEGDRVRLTGRADVDVELSLQGPRGRTPWVAASRRGVAFEVELSVLVDEWGLGATSLPADQYAVLARRSRPDAPGDEPLPAVAARTLWRRLPFASAAWPWTYTPLVEQGGELHLRVEPAEWRASRPALYRRRLRDERYPAERERPLTDTVLFETFAGKSTGDNPGALCRELLRRDTGLDLAFSVVDRSSAVPDGVRAVVRYSEEYFCLLGRARYLLVNAALPYFFRKREGQLYVQTWHGSPLKRIAHDRPHLDFFNWNHRRQLLIARDGWDYLLSQSPFCSKALSSAFRYDGPVLEAGYPRNDVLLSADRDRIRRRVRSGLGLQDADRVVLYAPTWRDNLRVGRVFDKVLYLDTDAVTDGVSNGVVLVRGHYNSVGAAESSDRARRVVDVTRYPDIADLYLAADCLVTDYSSVFFDFALTDKPMVFLAPDLVEYRDDNRGFYLDYHETVPGPVCVTTREVVEALDGPDLHAEQRAEFRRRYTPLDDGHAAERVIDHILDVHPPLG